MIIALASELLVAIFLHLDLQDLVRCKQVCKVLGQIVDNALVLQYKIECEAYGMVDGDNTEFTVAERMQRLHDMRNAWMSSAPTETFPLQNNWAASVEHYVQYRPFAFGCVIAVCQVAGNRRCHRMLLTQVPSKYRNIEKKEWVLDNICFDLPGLSIDHSQRLLVTAQTCGFADNHLLRISILDSENGMAHPCAKEPIIETRTMASLDLQIAGDYVGVLADSAYSFSSVLQVWNWKTAEKVLCLNGLDFSCFVLIDGPYVILPARRPSSSADYALLILSCKNGNLTSLEDVASRHAIAELSLLEKQCRNIVVSTDNARGPPHDAKVPFRRNLNLRFLRVQVKVDKPRTNSTKRKVWTDRFEYFVPYRNITALISQASALAPYAPPIPMRPTQSYLFQASPSVVTIRTVADPHKRMSATGDVADFLGTQIFIWEMLLNSKGEPQSQHEHCTLFDFNSLPARRDDAPSPHEEAGGSDATGSAEVQRLSSKKCYSYNDAYLELRHWMELRPRQLVSLLDDGLVGVRPDISDLGAHQADYRYVVSAF